MAQTIKLKRSATPGAVPSTSSLALGEVAINTNDGKMYIKKDDGTESIVEIGSSALSDSFKLYEYAVSSSQTTFSGSDDNSNTLAYNTGSPPYVQVFLNGVLLDWSTDYTATNGTSVVLSTAAASGDLIQIAAYSSTVVSSTSLSFDDNNKLLLGTSSDLELFHDGSNSIINDAGTGNLKFQVGGSDIYSVTTDGIVLANGLDVEASEFIGDIRGAVLFKAQAGEALSKGDVVYISGISGNTTVVSKADADDAAKMPAFGVVADTASSGNPVDIYTNGILSGINTGSFSIGDELYVSTTAGVLTNSPPTGESAKLQKIAKVTRSDTSAGSIFITGAGRTNAVPNLDDGDIFIGNSSNQAVTATLDTSIVPENGNLYYTDARVDSHLNQSTASNGEYLKWNGSDYEWATTPAESDTLADVTGRGNTTTDRVNVGRDRNDSFAISLDTKGPITWNGSLDTSVGLGVTGATTYTDRFTIKHSNGTLGDDIQIELLPSQTNSNNGNVYIGGGLKLADEINVGVTAFIDDDGANPYPRLILRDTSAGLASAVTHTSLGPLAVGSADTKLKAHTGRLHLQADDATTIILDKTGSGSLATFYNTDTTPADGDIIGELAFHQYAGGTPNDDVSARIIAQHNGTSGDGKLAFHAGPTGATLEILRMTNTGGTFASRKLVMPVTASANSGYLFNAEGQSTGLVLANGGVGGDTIAIDNNNTRVFSHNVVQQTAKFGTKVEIEDTTQSTSTTTGSLVVDGGVGIAKNLNVGNSLEVATIMSDRSFFSTPNSLVIKVLQNAADDASIDGSDIGIYAGASNLIGGIGGASGGDIRLVTGAATGTGGSNGSIFFATGGVATSSSQSNGTNVGSFSGSGNFNLFSLGTNTAPGTDDLKLSGYGLMGNRSSPVYVTNAGTGGVQINADGVHGTSPRVALFDQGGITFDEPLTATGEVYTSSSQNAWAFRATTGTTSNSSGLWFTGTTARLLLRDSSGNIKTMLAANGTNAENVINNNTIWHAGNDGSGSGLDADTLDGNQASAFATLTGATFTGDIIANGLEVGTAYGSDVQYLGIKRSAASSNDYILIQGSSSDAGSTYLSAGSGKNVHIRASANSTANQLVVTTSGTTIGGNTVWHAGNDGSGSGLDADTLDGVQASGFLRTNGSNTGTYIDLYRDVNSGLGAYIDFREGSAQDIRLGVNVFDNELPQAGTALVLDRINSGGGDAHLVVHGEIFAAHGGTPSNGNKVWHAGNDGSGSGLDADTVDGIQASSFLRSDANDTTTGKLLISVASNATDLLRVASTTSYGYMQVAGINGADAGLIFQEGTSNRCMVGHDQSADSFRIYWYNDTNGNVINNNRLTLTSSGNLNVTGNITGTTGLVSGQTSARYPIKVYSNQWPEVQFFRGSAEELRIGAAEASGSYNSAAGDFYVFDVGTGKMNLLVPSNGGSFKRNNGAYTVWDSGNDGSGSGLDADTLDGYHSTSFRTVGGGLSAASGTWYTIAYNAGNRASARFHIRDTLSSRHQSVHFYASHMYGNGNAINVVHSNVFSTSPIRYIRIKEGGTYDGALLQVYFDSTSTFQAFMYENDQSSGWVLLGTPVPDGTSTGISVGNFAALTNVGAQVDIDKSVRGGFIGTGSLYMDGNITAYSDRRVKSNLQVIPDALNKVKSLNGYTFDRTDQFKDDGRQTGLIAQEVLEVLPEAVIGDEEGGYALAYGNMVGLLVEAIKELKSENTALEDRIAALENN